MQASEPLHIVAQHAEGLEAIASRMSRQCVMVEAHASQATEQSARVLSVPGPAGSQVAINGNFS